MKNKFTTKDMTVVGLMAAMVFVFTYFLGISIPTPTGTTMLKTANAVCLLGGIMFGGVKGGLAAGLGSAFFDLSKPEYAAGAPVTFLLFFAMGFVAGVVANFGKPQEMSRLRCILGASAGAFTYWVLYLTKTIGGLVISGSEFIPAVTANIAKITTSSINAVFAVVMATILAPILTNALKKAKII